jgi:hypothetical protein
LVVCFSFAHYLFPGEAYLFQRREAYDRYKMLAEKHKLANDEIMLNLERESFTKLQESGRS